MRCLFIIASCISLLTSLASAEPLAPGQRTSERAATKSEIEQAAVGRRFASGLSYGADGKFSYKGGMLGVYRIQDGAICETFASGRVRCDKVYTDGKNFVLIDKRGKRYPFR